LKLVSNKTYDKSHLAWGTKIHCDYEDTKRDDGLKICFIEVAN